MAISKSLKYVQKYGERFDELGLPDHRNVSVSDVFSHELDTNWMDSSSELFRMYREADPEERSIIDAVFINLCGWSYTTLVEKSLEYEDDLDI